MSVVELSVTVHLHNTHNVCIGFTFGRRESAGSLGGSNKENGYDKLS